MENAKTISKDYMSAYATANKAENFAEHFAYYVVEAEAFRNKSKTDQKLLEKYLFFKQNIFQEKEY